MPLSAFSSITSMSLPRPLTPGEMTHTAWEEPHPGQRLLLPGELTSSSCDEYATHEGDCRSDMAAKDPVGARPRIFRSHPCLRLHKTRPKPQDPRAGASKAGCSQTFSPLSDNLALTTAPYVAQPYDHDALIRSFRPSTSELSGFSNHLGIAVSTNNDFYGWEAELVRRETTKCSNLINQCSHGPTHRCRQAYGSSKLLFHRALGFCLTARSTDDLGSNLN